jgi:hypothetical protein
MKLLRGVFYGLILVIPFWAIVAVVVGRFLNK